MCEKLKTLTKSYKKTTAGYGIWFSLLWGDKSRLTHD